MSNDNTATSKLIVAAATGAGFALGMVLTNEIIKQQQRSRPNPRRRRAPRRRR